MDNLIGLYVHIPFCRKKCNYCDFNSYSGCYDMQKDYFSALFSEIEEKEKLCENFVCDTIYIGGGTPTSVDTEYITELLKMLKKHFNISKDAEITIECNPKTAEISDFEEYLNCGINRLSIGRQTSNNKILKTLGRIHTDEDFEKCLFDAKKAGFENISADLMFALPNQTEKIWTETLLKSVNCGLSHISCYGLKIEEGTPFYNMNLDLPNDDKNADMYEKAVKILENAGYMQYEISNFAKKDKKSKHNLKYWSHMPYLGLGAGACSSFLNERYANTSNLLKYINEAKTKNFLKNDFISLSKNDQMSEYMFMGLRKTEGINLLDFKKRFGCACEEVFSAQIDKYLKMNALIKEDENLYINKKLLYISNSILCDFV